MRAEMDPEDAGFGDGSRVAEDAYEAQAVGVRWGGVHMPSTAAQ